MAKRKKKRQNAQKVIPVNTKAKDTFFKKVYENENQQRELVSFLLGIDLEKASLANVRPVLFGNKENDFSCLCDDIFYVLTEGQASVSPNISYRLLEYVVAGLRTMVNSEQLLYSRTRVCFPIPKLYVLQVGLEIKNERLLSRGIFVDLLSDKEVCDMTMAQFSRDDILIYQGREEGREDGDILRLIKIIYKKMLKGKTSEEIADAVEEDIPVVEQIKEVIIEYKKLNTGNEFDANGILQLYKKSHC